MTRPVVTITVSGITGSGKSAVLAAIERLLMQEFRITTISSPDLAAERRLANPDSPTLAEIQNLSNYDWLLTEHNLPREAQPQPASNTASNSMYSALEAAIQNKQGLHLLHDYGKGQQCMRCYGIDDGSGTSDLTTDCPGVELTQEQHAAVIRNTQDYTNEQGWHPVSKIGK